MLVANITMVNGISLSQYASAAGCSVSEIKSYNDNKTIIPGQEFLLPIKKDVDEFSEDYYNILLNTPDSKKASTSSKSILTKLGNLGEYVDSKLDVLGPDLKTTVQVMDPTGITGYKDVKDSYNAFESNSSLGNGVMLASAVLAALPAVGMFGSYIKESGLLKGLTKGSKVADEISTVTKETVDLEKIWGSKLAKSVDLTKLSNDEIKALREITEDVETLGKEVLSKEKSELLESLVKELEESGKLSENKSKKLNQLYEEILISGVKSKKLPKSEREEFVKLILKGLTGIKEVEELVDAESLMKEFLSSKQYSEYVTKGKISSLPKEITEEWLTKFFTKSKSEREVILKESGLKYFITDPVTKSQLLGRGNISEEQLKKILKKINDSFNFTDDRNGLNKAIRILDAQQNYELREYLKTELTKEKSVIDILYPRSGKASRQVKKELLEKIAAKKVPFTDTLKTSSKTDAHHVRQVLTDELNFFGLSDKDIKSALQSMDKKLSGKSSKQMYEYAKKVRKKSGKATFIPVKDVTHDNIILHLTQNGLNGTISTSIEKFGLFISGNNKTAFRFVDSNGNISQQFVIDHAAAGISKEEIQKEIQKIVSESSSRKEMQRKILSTFKGKGLRQIDVGSTGYSKETIGLFSLDSFRRGGRVHYIN